MENADDRYSAALSWFAPRIREGEDDCAAMVRKLEHDNPELYSRLVRREADRLALIAAFENQILDIQEAGDWPLTLM